MDLKLSKFLSLLNKTIFLEKHIHKECPDGIATSTHGFLLFYKQ